MIITTKIIINFLCLFFNSKILSSSEKFLFLWSSFLVSLRVTLVLINFHLGSAHLLSRVLTICQTGSSWDWSPESTDEQACNPIRMSEGPSKDCTWLDVGQLNKAPTWPENTNQQTNWLLLEEGEITARRISLSISARFTWGERRRLLNSPLFFLPSVNFNLTETATRAPSYSLRWKLVRLVTESFTCVPWAFYYFTEIYCWF